MDYDWLRNSVIGVIILGAIGSILGSFFLWLDRYIIEATGIDWLKNTVIGVIILAAIGSILAFFLVWLVRYIVRRRSKSRLKYDFACGKLQSESDVFKINTYYAFHSIRVVTHLLLSIIFFVLFFIMLGFPTSKNDLLSLSIYIPIFLAFLSLIGAYFEYNNIRRWYLAVMTPIFNEAIERHQNIKGQQ